MGVSQTQKKELMLVTDKCCWCGVTMVLHPFHKGQQHLPDELTIDHIYPVTDIRRIEYKKKKRPSPFVLCCYQCNLNRSNKPIELQIKHTGIKEITVFFFRGNRFSYNTCNVRYILNGGIHV